MTPKEKRQRIVQVVLRWDSDWDYKVASLDDGADHERLMTGCLENLISRLVRCMRKIEKEDSRAQ